MEIPRILYNFGKGCSFAPHRDLNKVPIVLTTYETLEKNLNKAIVDISKENFIEDKIVTITIEK